MRLREDSTPGHTNWNLRNVALGLEKMVGEWTLIPAPTSQADRQRVMFRTELGIWGVGRVTSAVSTQTVEVFLPRTARMPTAASLHTNQQTKHRESP